MRKKRDSYQKMLRSSSFENPWLRGLIDLGEPTGFGVKDASEGFGHGHENVQMKNDLGFSDLLLGKESRPRFSDLLNNPDFGVDRNEVGKSSLSVNEPIDSQLNLGRVKEDVEPVVDSSISDNVVVRKDVKFRNLDNRVEEIIKTVDGMDVRSRVLEKYYRIRDDKEAVSFVDQTFETPQDIAVMAQIYRDPLFESSRAFYVRGNKIVGHQGLTLNMPKMTQDPPVSHVRELVMMLKADGVYFLHNHPSGSGFFSEADKKSELFWKRMLPEYYKGAIVIDSGRFSVGGVNADGKFYSSKHNLTNERGGWERAEDDYGMIARNDPLFKGIPGILRSFSRGIRKVRAELYYDDLHYDDEYVGDLGKEVIGLRDYLKATEGWTTVIFMKRSTDRAQVITEYAQLARLTARQLKRLLDTEARRYGVDYYHVVTDESLDLVELKDLKSGLLNSYAKEKMENVRSADLNRGVGSIWMKGKFIDSEDWRDLEYQRNPEWLEGHFDFLNWIDLD